MINREKIIEKLEKEVKRTYAIKSAIWEYGENGYEKISEEITEHREPFVTLMIEMADKILALLKKQEAIKPIAEEDDTFECFCGAIVGWEELDSSGIVTTRFNYCPFCGRPVKWE